MAYLTEEDVVIRRIPNIGQIYRAKDFSIEIIDKKPSQSFNAAISVAKVVASENRNHKVGDIIEIEEIAFYSDYYQFLK